MKRFLTLVALLIATAVTMSAQTDIKKLNKIGEAAILRALGNPAEKWDVTDIDAYPCLGTVTMYGYGPSGCYLIISPKNKELLFFDTESPKYCILSDVVPGGIKVGTKLSDLEKFNFSKTRYGRNKPGNELKLDKGQPSDPSDKRYTIYGLEYCRINLRIKNGVVTGWQFLTAENDYEVNYDKSISFF